MGFFIDMVRYILRLIRKYSLELLAAVDMILLAALIWLLKVTGWSFWGYW